VKPHCYKEKGILFFDEVALEIFRETISTADKSAVPAVQIPPASVQDKRLEGIEKSLIAMAEKMNAMVESNKIIIEENRALRFEISAFQKSLVFEVPQMPASPPELTSNKNTEKKDLPPARSAPSISSQAKELSLWESAQLYMNDLSGFFLGRG